MNDLNLYNTPDKDVFKIKACDYLNLIFHSTNSSLIIKFMNHKNIYI
jgi:hypothetical protein